MTTARRNAVLTALLAAALAGGAEAQNVGSFPFDRFSFTVGSYYQTTDNNLRLDASADNLGTEISLERDLDLPESEQLLRLGLEWRPGERHQLSASYYELSRDGSRTLARDLEFGDVVFPLNATLTSSSDLEYYNVAYTYWAVKTPRGGLGLGLGGAGIALEASLEARVARPGGTNEILLEESASTDLPVPLLGVEGRYALSPRFMIAGEVQVLPSVQIEDYEGSALAYGARLEWRFSRHFGLGAAWNSFNIDVDVDRPRFHGALDLTVEGAQAFLRVAL